MGNIGTITDGTYNVNWVIYTISGNTYQLFSMRNLGSHRMDSGNTISDGYTGSEMYTYIHNTVLPNLKKSGLNITACDLVSDVVYNDICSKTGIKYNVIAAEDGRFWLTNYVNGEFFYVDGNGSTQSTTSYYYEFGVRPLITVVK